MSSAVVVGLFFFFFFSLIFFSIDDEPLMIVACCYSPTVFKMRMLISSLGLQVRVYSHESAVLQCTMKFSVILPDQVSDDD